MVPPAVQPYPTQTANPFRTELFVAKLIHVAPAPDQVTLVLLGKVELPLDQFALAVPATKTITSLVCVVKGNVSDVAFVFAVPMLPLSVIAIYATATQRHLEVSVFQKKPTSRRVVVTVVVGRVAVEDSKEAPQVRATAPVPVIEIRRVSPSTGVPVRPEVNDVMAAVWLVMWTTS